MTYIIHIRNTFTRKNQKHSFYMFDIVMAQIGVRILAVWSESSFVRLKKRCIFGYPNCA